MTRIRVVACAAAAAAVLAVGARADAPPVYAIRGARIVTAAGAPIGSGTLVMRHGLIDAVGPSVQPPPDAIVIDGAGMTVYPGLIDMGNATGLDVQVNLTQPDTLRTSEEAERWKRGVIFRPELEAADHVRPDVPELSRLTATGVTSVLATPPGVVVKGRSALLNVVGPVDEPQIGGVGDYRRGLQVVRTPVALHVEFPGNVRGDGYPAALLGVIAFVRQSFLDAQHQQLAQQRYERAKTGASRPPYDPALEALQPALAGRMPVAFEASLAREIRRALDMAKEFKLNPVITGARETDQVAADLKAANARVIYSLNFPERSRLLAPDADEPVRELRARVQASKAPAALEKAGIMFAFSSSGLRESRDFVRNAARVVKDGLSAEAAIRALTINAATIAGAGDRLGSLEKGKIANVIVTDGDLFEERTKVKHAFVDGRMVVIDDTPLPSGRGGRSGH
ncbi:MAG: amidohydrolase family protein [Acidobacteria bacterium]|nr:amidohydrolase family protein [Acidobacteriota bacterium]MCA1651257.1 amidohydrolase family protein [Acidobacteriota bacterium]